MKSVCHSCTYLLEFHVHHSAKVSWHQTQYVNLTCDFFVPSCIYHNDVRKISQLSQVQVVWELAFFYPFPSKIFMFVRVVPCRRISAVSQFLCFEHVLPFFESWSAWAASIERHNRLGTFTHQHHLIYIDNISKIIVGLNNVHLLQATLISTKSKLLN